MAISDLSQLLDICTGGSGGKQRVDYFVDNRVGAAASPGGIASQYLSLWQNNRMPGGGGAAPGGTARNPTNTTQGALLQADAGGGRTNYLGGFFACANSACMITWADRLADISGLSGTVTTAQNTTSLAVTRYTGTESRGNQIFIEIYTAVGATATTLSVEYTNQDGTTGRTSQLVVFGGTNRREVGRMIWVPLANGDTGVRSVESVTVTATTGTAGDFGVTIVRPIINAAIGVGGTGVLVDCLTQIATRPEIKAGACLFPFYYATATSTISTNGFFSFVEA